jgi:hypothetical protein
MPRRRPRVRRSTSSETDWLSGAPAVPNVFTLQFDDKNSFDYTFQVGGVTHRLKALLDGTRNPPPGEVWHGLAQPSTIDCQSDGTAPITPSNVICTYEHRHVIPARVEGDGDFRGSGRRMHVHEVPLALFVSASWDDPDIDDDRFGWYAPHLAHGVAE